MVDLGAFSTGLVTGLREGVEASLIVSIILAYLVRTGGERHIPRIWFGAGAAVMTSLVVGVALWVTVGELPSPYEQVFEGSTLLLAAGVVTWMLFWMRRQSKALSGELRAAIDRALTGSGAWGLAVLTFTAIVREGIESSLFLVGQVTAASQGSDAGAASVLVGALVGLAVAIGIGMLIYRGSRRINLARFFRWTGISLVFIAAGLLASGIHEFIEIGVITIGTHAAFDISGLLPDESGVGQFLHAIVGYSAAPEVTRLVVHLGYLATVLVLYLRPTPPRLAETAKARGVAQG